jgi:hypothetical protein
VLRIRRKMSWALPKGVIQGCWFPATVHFLCGFGNQVDSRSDFIDGFPESEPLPESASYFSNMSIQKWFTLKLVRFEPIL